MVAVIEDMETVSPVPSVVLLIKISPVPTAVVVTVNSIVSTAPLVRMWAWSIVPATAERWSAMAFAVATPVALAPNAGVPKSRVAKVAGADVVSMISPPSNKSTIASQAAFLADVASITIFPFSLI